MLLAMVYRVWYGKEANTDSNIEEKEREKCV